MSFPAKTSAKAILDAAMEIVEQAGREGLSMRAVAHRLGVQASSLYHHFQDREELEGEMAKHAEGELLAWTRGSKDLGDFAAAYQEFARSRPALFGLIAGGKGCSRALPIRLLQLRSIRSEDQAEAFWCFLAGNAALEAAGMVRGEGFERRVRAWIDIYFEA